MEQEEKKSYYAVIPAEVRYNNNITPNAKLLYGEITALCNEKGYCWASNQYFANLYNVSKVTVSRWISSLVENKFIYLELDQEDNNKRKILLYPINKNVNTPITKMLTPINKNVNYNNKYNNNKNNNRVSEQNQKILDQYNDVFSTKLKSDAGWCKNAEYWLTIYTLEDVLNAIVGIKKDAFWFDKMDLCTLFRRKNPRGEDVDYISKMLSSYEKSKPKSFMIGI